MDKGGEYSLKWNSHKTTVMSAFTCLYENEKHADCTLAAEGKSIKAHKVMIAACSPYLERLIEDHSKDKSSTPILIFNDLSFFELKALCEYMYKGEVNVPKEHLDSFLKVAKTLQVRGLCDGGGGDSVGGDKMKTPEKGVRKVSVQQGKRKRQDGFDSDTSGENVSFMSSPSRGTAQRAKQLKTTAKVVAACPPRVVQEVKPIEIKQEQQETVYEETVYQDLTFDGEIYHDPNSEPGTSHNEATIEYGWDGNSNDETVAQDQDSQFDGKIETIIERTVGGVIEGTEEGVVTFVQLPPRKRHHCHDCGRSYKLPTSLFNHKKYECGKGASFVCVECPMMFKRPENLKRHVNAKHNPHPVVYMCRLCGHLTKTKGNLKTHMINTHNAVESVTIPKVVSNTVHEDKD